MHLHRSTARHAALVAGLAVLVTSASCGRVGFEYHNATTDPADGGSSADSASDTADAAPLALNVLGQASFDVDTGTSGPGVTVMDMTVAPSGDVYLTGAYSSANFGGASYAADGSTDAYIARLDPQLGERWLQGFGGASTSVGLRLLWHDASVYSFSNFQGPLDDAGIVAPNQGQDDHLLVRMNADAQVEDWAVFGSAGDDDFGRGLWVTDDGYVLTGGACAGPFDYGGGALVGDGSRDPCMALLDSNLEHVSSDRLLGPGRDTTRALAAFPNGDVLIVGDFIDTLTIDGVELVSAGAQDVFAARLRPDGSVVWKNSFGGPADDFPEHAVIDDQGDVYIAVNTDSASWQYGETLLQFDTATGPDAALVSSDDAGVPRWAVVLTGPGREVIEDIALLADGSIALTGGFMGPATLAGQTVEAAGGDQDLLLGVINSGGDVVWQRAFGSPGEDLFTAVHGHPAGGLVAAGHAGGPVDFGAGPVGDNTPDARGIIAHVTVE